MDIKRSLFLDSFWVYKNYLILSFVFFLIRHGFKKLKKQAGAELGQAQYEIG